MSDPYEQQAREIVRRLTRIRDDIVGAYDSADSQVDVIANFARAQRAAALEEAAGVVREHRERYPADIFIEPPSGEHGQTVDACSARAIRFACDRLAELLDARAQQAREGGGP